VLSVCILDVAVPVCFVSECMNKLQPARVS
jgi:hypothetical protein